MIVVWLFLAVPWGCLQFVIVIFPDHTHLIFFIVFNNLNIFGRIKKMHYKIYDIDSAF